MAILFILFVIILVIYFSFNSYLQHIIEVYLENNKVKHLKPIGIDENAFIGLHKKELALKEAYMIYARKTTAYKGVILFNPDTNLTYRFYMPLINFLCRQGYIIATYQQHHRFYSKSIQDLSALYDCINNDEILKTYPLFSLGHGSGALIQLCLPLERVIQTVGFQPRINEIDEILKLCKHKHPKVKDIIIKIIQNKYSTNVNLNIINDKPTYIINGQKDEQQTIQIEHANIKTIAELGHYPFLNNDSEQHIKSLECLLAYEDTPVFEYNKAIETFDISTLYDLNKEILDILPLLFEYEK